MRILQRICQLTCLLGLAGLLAAPAVAQYKWVDENGRTVYSDQPPPPGRPLTGQLVPPAPVSPPTPPAARPAPADGARAARQRADDGRKASERQAQEERRAAELRQICADRRDDLRVLDSGIRIMRVDAQGERAYLNEDEITRRRQALAQSIEAECRER